MRLAQDRFKEIDGLQGGDFGTGFECVLPPEVRAELLGRPKLTKPLLTPARRKPVRGVIVRIAGGLALALLITLILQPAHPPLTPTGTQADRLVASSEVASIGDILLTHETQELTPPDLPAPRAELVQFPAPRAELVTRYAPALNHYPIEMPYGVHVLIRWIGYADSAAGLPMINNSVGDAYSVWRDTLINYLGAEVAIG
jgi:hypothetical protein